MTIEQSLVKKREKYLKHLAHRTYVAQMYEHLRRVRGETSQTAVACMADVVQSYISRVESGITGGIGMDALSRILSVYKELEDAGRH